LSSRSIAIATGSLKEPAFIEIHPITKSIKGNKTTILKKHSDMIDSLLKLDFDPEKVKYNNLYVQWMLSASRDRQIVLWKLLDGKVLMKSNCPASFNG
jgi:hypothetical protein